MEVEEVLFCPGWTASEELKLLSSIDEYGYGNWVSVSSQVGKSPEECKAHYVHFYLNEPHPSLPVLPPPLPHGDRHNDPLRASGSDPEPPYYPGTEIGGYMPHRGDFVVEPHDDAEKDIADLNLDPDADDVVTALHLAAVSIYCHKLRQRAYKKRFIRDYGLLDIRKQLATDESRLTRKQMMIKTRMKAFIRFRSPEDAEKLLQSLYHEQQLCAEIKKLQEHRRHGITTVKGGELYDRLATKRKQQREEQRDGLKRACTSEEDWFYRLVSGERGGNKKAVTVHKERPPLDITHSLGVEKLSADEKELCSHCRLQPQAYLQYRAQLVAECKKEGRLRLADARRLLKIDVNKTRKIYNFLNDKGLIMQ